MSLVVTGVPLYIKNHQKQNTLRRKKHDNFKIKAIATHVIHIVPLKSFCKTTDIENNNIFINEQHCIHV